MIWQIGFPEKAMREYSKIVCEFINESGELSKYL